MGRCTKVTLCIVWHAEKEHTWVQMAIGTKENGRTIFLQGMERQSIVTSNHTRANFTMENAMERAHSSKMGLSLSDNSKVTK